MEHDMRALARVMPEASLEEEDDLLVLSVPVTGYVSAELEPDGSVWLRRWHPDGTVLSEEKRGSVSPGLAPEEAVRAFSAAVELLRKEVCGG